MLSVTESNHILIYTKDRTEKLYHLTEEVASTLQWKAVCSEQ